MLGKDLSMQLTRTGEPNEVIMSPNGEGADMGLGDSGTEPENIKDPKIRAEYKIALEKNRQQIERYTKQYHLRDWLKDYPKRQELYIVRAYSTLPYNNEELQQFLDKYIEDKATRERILTSVKTNIEKVDKERRK